MKKENAKEKVIKILKQAQGERAAGNEAAARNMEDQAAALQAMHNLPMDDDAAARHRVEAAWAKIPLDAQVYIRIKDPGMPRFRTHQMKMSEALPTLLAKKALFAGRVGDPEIFALQKTIENTDPIVGSREDYLPPKEQVARSIVEAAWREIPTDAQVYIRVPDPKAPGGVTTIQVTMKKALPMLLEEKATYAGLADANKSTIFWW